MTTIYGYQKGIGCRPINSKKNLAAVPVEAATTQADATTSVVGGVLCTVCGKRFKKLQPMAVNHYRARHADLGTGEDAWKKYLKES